jgi:hypothetical protein
LPHPLDGGRWDRPRLGLESRDALPCENDQAKPDRLSRLSRSTLLSKILLAFRLSGAAWIEARTVTSGLSSNLLRLARFLLCSSRGHFCANLLNLSKFRCCVKHRFCWNQGRNSSSTAGRFSCLFDRHSGGNCSGRRRSHCAKFQTTTSDNSPAHFARTRGLASWVMQWGCSLRGSQQGSGVRIPLPQSNPTNRLPTSLLGQATQATGRLHCYICNFSRVAQATQ